MPRVREVSGSLGAVHGGRSGEVPDVDTGVPRERLAELLESSNAKCRADFHPHPKIKGLLEGAPQDGRAASGRSTGRRPKRWPLARLAADRVSASALSGQDSGRGTFSQRHAVLHDIEDGHRYMPLATPGPDQAPVEIYNSPLSETGVLGFEYGYSLDYPDGAGDVGGPVRRLRQRRPGDHRPVHRQRRGEMATAERTGAAAAARLGRVGTGALQRPAGALSAAGGATTTSRSCYPTTPAQYFHCLRRQVIRRWRKPLIVMTPKSLLRHPGAVSPLDDLADGVFQRIIPTGAGKQAVERILLCSGKIYYELDRIAANWVARTWPFCGSNNCAPVPVEPLRAALAGYRMARRSYWVQEEPVNMGAWRYPAAYSSGTGCTIGCRSPASAPRVGQPGHRLRQPPPPRAAGTAAKGFRVV